MLIVPAILELTTEKLIEQILRVDRELPQVQYVHIDIMDGIFVPGLTEIDVTQLENLRTRLKFELHLMVSNPIPFMHRWSGVEEMKRVIIHQESLGNMHETISTARGLDYEVGIAVNPNTTYTDTDYRTFDFASTDKIDVVMFMSVIPGAQGSPFVPAVLEKIKSFVELRKTYKDSLGEPYTPLCACDGHVDPTTAPLLKSAGVEIFNVGSYLMKSPDLQKAYQELEAALKT